MFKKIVVAGIALFTLVLFFNEGAQAARADRRQHRQRARIHQGVKSGAITKKEARKLRHEQRQIRRMKRTARKDGVVTPREKARIENAQDQGSADIYNAKHGDLKPVAPPTLPPAAPTPAPGSNP